MAVISDTHVISFDEEAYSLGLRGFDEFESSNLRFTYRSGVEGLGVGGVGGLGGWV